MCFVSVIMDYLQTLGSEEDEERILGLHSLDSK